MTTRPAQAVRVFLADDHPAVREGLTLRLMQEGFVVCGEADSRAGLLAAIDDSRTDIALLDLTLCEESGLDLIADLRTRGIPVLIYSMHEDTDTVRRALERGARSYVTKRETSAVLIEALRRTLSGERYLSPRIAHAATVLENAAPAADFILSDRERQTLTLLAQGESHAEIALSLGISVRTVESYCGRILVKLELDGMKALRKYAIRHFKGV